MVRRISEAAWWYDLRKLGGKLGAPLKRRAIHSIRATLTDGNAFTGAEHQGCSRVRETLPRVTSVTGPPANPRTRGSPANPSTQHPTVEGAGWRWGTDVHGGLELREYPWLLPDSRFGVVARQPNVTHLLLATHAIHCPAGCGVGATAAPCVRSVIVAFTRKGWGCCRQLHDTQRHTEHASYTRLAQLTHGLTQLTHGLTQRTQGSDGVEGLL